MNARFLDRFKIAISLLFIIVVIGTIGYTLIEKWSILHSLYMTVITISTVGYSEIEPLSNTGKAFCIFLIVTGVGIMFYTVTMLAMKKKAGTLIANPTYDTIVEVYDELVVISTRKQLRALEVSTP